ncbi:hypothetical protein DFH06DRAFT_535924 [Mycena polygramma]|nr:hypothetical protein DFH06DRAFT_535924 [Mycena polygramma]
MLIMDSVAGAGLRLNYSKSKLKIACGGRPFDSGPWHKRTPLSPFLFLPFVRLRQLFSFFHVGSVTYAGVVMGMGKQLEDQRSRCMDSLAGGPCPRSLSFDAECLSSARSIRARVINQSECAAAFYSPWCSLVTVCFFCSHFQHQLTQYYPYSSLVKGQ